MIFSNPPPKNCSWTSLAALHFCWRGLDISSLMGSVQHHPIRLKIMGQTTNLNSFGRLEQPSRICSIWGVTKTWFTSWVNDSKCTFYEGNPITHTIHGTGIFPYIWLIFMVNVGKYTRHACHGLWMPSWHPSWLGKTWSSQLCWLMVQNSS